MPVVGYCRNLHSNLCPCFVCLKKFSLDNGVEDLLTHICFTHHIIVENIETIADFKEYMEYYAERLRRAPLKSFAKEFVVDMTDGVSEPREQKYYFLGEFSREDRNLRKDLHAKRLKAVKRQQKIDLGPQYFLRHCFYCHRSLNTTNAQFINHLKSHGFQLGHPDKLVYISKFIEAIEDTFRNLHCLYCEMEFESCRDLILHMENRGHAKIHPKNSFYDQFYMINYVEYGKTWLDFAKQKNKSSPEDNDIIVSEDDPDWSNWGTEPENIMCILCKHICRSWEGTLLHLQASHNFDFKISLQPLKFYEQVKIVNYIRRRTLKKLCVNCDFHSEDENDVLSHMERTNHLTIPNRDLWDHDEYFFCTLENDMFLCHLEENAEDDGIPMKNKEIVTSNENKECSVSDAESDSSRACASENSEISDEEVKLLVDQLESLKVEPCPSENSVTLDDVSKSLAEHTQQIVRKFFDSGITNKRYCLERGIDPYNSDDTVLSLASNCFLAVLLSQKNSGNNLVLPSDGADQSSKEVEMSAEAHNGGGDSNQNVIVITENRSVVLKKWNEFGDAKF